MSAQPVHDPRYDPQAILESLPEKYRAHFLAQYEEAIEAARRPDQFGRLYELLHTWWLSSIAFSDPTYELRQQQARDGTLETVPAAAVFPDWEERVTAARARRA